MAEENTNDTQKVKSVDEKKKRGRPKKVTGKLLGDPVAILNQE